MNALQPSSPARSSSATQTSSPAQTSSSAKVSSSPRKRESSRLVPATPSSPPTPSSPRKRGSSLLTLLLALALTACSDPANYTALPPGTTVLAFGDSVTYGTGARRGEDYPTHLATLSNWNVINAGIPGDTARGARNRLGSLLRQHEPAMVIIELGGNDFLRKRPERDVAGDLAAMIAEVEASGAQPILVAVPRLSLLRATTGTLKDSDIYAELAEASGVILVPDLFSDILSEDDLKADEIHPNAAGYQVLADGIAQRLQETGLLNR